MQIELTPEQRDFQESAGRLAAELAAGWHRGRGPHDIDPPTPDDKAWSRIVDAGWLAIGLREEYGGFGASAVDLAVLVERLGYHAVAAPVVGTLLAIEQLQTWGAPATLLEEVAAGALRVAPALTPQLRDFATQPQQAVAWDAAGATTTFLPDQGRLCRLGEPLAYADLTRAVARVAEPTEAIPVTAPSDEATDRLTAFGLSLLVADLLGTMQAALDAAVAHAKTRSQYGRPIGSFQAVQQLLVDSHVLVEASRSASYYASWAVDALPGPEALRAARRAKAFASRSAVEVCENVVQVFGGIGMTWEAPAHVWLRRAQGDRLVLGDEQHHEATIAATEFAPPERGTDLATAD
jgi:alkylation response protein AidB-like acyl-CoA dehydrogenase